ncbi:MUSK [Mytilus edulis]|uniref:MUSK n=1 Tax=Mytilus edulis TaxID=6550 RepID=A0A8S3TG98_MYTED|nr:MUSK [Mytilus edulis]
MQYLLTNSLDMHSNYYNSIATVKYDQSVDAEGPFEGTRITCACLCHSDNTCASISYNKVLQMCWKHNLDPTRNLDKIQKDNNWDIMYTGTVEFAPKVLNYTAPEKITYNQRVNVTCIVIGNPYPIISMLTTTTYHNVEPTKTGLTVISFEREHNGHYKCIATNKHGTDEIVFVLKGQP